jgi:hypothetical protein
MKKAMIMIMIVLLGLVLGGCKILMPELPDTQPEPEPIINETPVPAPVINESVVSVNVSRIQNTTNETTIVIEEKFDLDFVCFRQCVDRDIKKCMDNTTIKKEGDIYLFNASLNWTEQDLESNCTFDLSTNRTDICTGRCLG